MTGVEKREWKDWIRLEQVSIVKKGCEILPPISLRVREGEVCVLFGGDEERVHALCSILAGILCSDSGKVYLAGERLGCFLGKALYYEKLDIRKNLYVIQSLQKKTLSVSSEEIEELLTLVGLEGIGGRGRSLQSYSEGMKRCYGIATVLLQKPVALVLEGILDGMGEGDTKMVQEVILRLKDKGLTLLLSTSDQEAEKTWKWIGEKITWIPML